MRTQLLIAACLACAATTALAQARLGSGVVGTMGGNGALTDVGGSAFGARPLPSDPRTPGAIDPRTGAPAAPASSAPAAAQSNDRAAAPSSTPVLDGAVWGSARPSAEPTESNQGQGRN
jgi:hypothetical protein